MALLLTASAVAQDQARPPDRLDASGAIELALRHSPSLQAMRSEALAAAAGARVSAARRGPQLSLNGFATSGTQTAVVPSSPGVMPQAFMMTPDERNFLDLNAMLMVPLYTGGVLENAVKASSALARAAAADVAEMEAETRQMVQESFLRVLLADRLIASETARVDATTRMVEDAKALLAAGRGIEANVRRAEAELAMARKELAMRRADRGKALVELLARMGVDPGATPVIEGVLAAGPEPLPLDTYVASARERRGIVSAARARLASAEASLRQAQGTLKPQVYGFAMGDVTNQEMMERGHTLGITVSFPLFDSGERRAEVAQMRSMRDAARAQVRQAELAAESQVRQAWLDLQAAREGLAAATSALASAEAAYDVMRVRVESGRGIAVELLDALAATVKARAEVADSEFMVRMALLTLERSSGVEVTK